MDGRVKPGHDGFSFARSKIQGRLGFGGLALCLCGLALGLFKDGRVLPGQMQRTAWTEKLLDGNDLNLQKLPVAGLKEASGCSLLLARSLARPFNLLIRDEPTNDLDLETLDLLQEVLADYKGTLLIVSHDRDFRAAPGKGRILSPRTCCGQSNCWVAQIQEQTY